MKEHFIECIFGENHRSLENFQVNLGYNYIQTLHRRGLSIASIMSSSSENKSSNLFSIIIQNINKYYN